MTTLVVFLKSSFVWTLDIFEKEKTRSPWLQLLITFTRSSSIFLKKFLLDKNFAFSISKIFFTKGYVIGLIVDNYKLTGLKWVMAIAAIAWNTRTTVVNFVRTTTIHARGKNESYFELLRLLFLDYVKKIMFESQFLYNKSAFSKTKNWKKNRFTQFKRETALLSHTNHANCWFLARHLLL